MADVLGDLWIGSHCASFVADLARMAVARCHPTERSVDPVKGSRAGTGPDLGPLRLKRGCLSGIREADGSYKLFEVLRADCMPLSETWTPER